MCACKIDWLPKVNICPGKLCIYSSMVKVVEVLHEVLLSVLTSQMLLRFIPDTMVLQHHVTVTVNKYKQTFSSLPPCLFIITMRQQCHQQESTRSPTITCIWCTANKKCNSPIYLGSLVTIKFLEKNIRKTMLFSFWHFDTRTLLEKQIV